MQLPSGPGEGESVNGFAILSAREANVIRFTPEIATPLSRRINRRAVDAKPHPRGSKLLLRDRVKLPVAVRADPDHEVPAFCRTIDDVAHDPLRTLMPRRIAFVRE